MTKQIKPPFTYQSALDKVQRGEDLWNTKDPEKVALAYTVDTQWRNREHLLNGHDEIKAFLTAKWNKEHSYKLKKELFTFSGNRIGVHFEYEWHDDKGQWYRSHGNENWIFNDDGLMTIRDASINDQKIDEQDRHI